MALEKAPYDHTRALFGSYKRLTLERVEYNPTKRPANTLPDFSTAKLNLELELGGLVSLHGPTDEAADLVFKLIVGMHVTQVTPSSQREREREGREGRERRRGKEREGEGEGEGEGGR